MHFTYVPSTSLPKLSILALYWRVFSLKPYRYAVYVTATFIILIWISNVAVDFAECTPFAYSWDKSIPGGHCLNIIILLRYISVSGLVTDAAIMCIPLPMVWHLHVPLSQKVFLAATFLAGSM